MCLLVEIFKFDAVHTESSAALKTVARATGPWARGLGEWGRKITKDMEPNSPELGMFNPSRYGKRAKRKRKKK